MTPFATIRIPRHRDAQGNPTCAAAFPDAACPFFGVKGVGGQREVCAYGAPSVGLNRRANAVTGEHGAGTLVPRVGCPVWAETNGAEMAREGR